MLTSSKKIDALVIGFEALRAEVSDLKVRSTRRPDLSKPMTIDPCDPEQFVSMSLQRGLQKLFDDSAFSICQLDTLIDLARIRVDQRVYDSLRALHCLKWNEMDVELRRQTEQQIIAMFIVSDDRTESD